MPGLLAASDAIEWPWDRGSLQSHAHAVAYHFAEVERIAMEERAAR